MTIESFPHTDSPAESEDYLRKLFRLFASSGVVENVAGELKVTAGAGLTVDVAAGEAYVDGFQMVSDAVENLALAAADGANPRIDLIVARYTPEAVGTSGRVTLEVVTGVPAAAPAVPALTRVPDGVWEIALAEVTVNAGSGVPNVITDVREFTASPLPSIRHTEAHLVSMVGSGLAGAATVTWDQPFDAAPVVVAAPAMEQSSALIVSASVKDITTTGCTVEVSESNDTGTVSSTFEPVVMVIAMDAS